jgi:hypothetical protein
LENISDAGSLSDADLDTSRESDDASSSDDAEVSESEPNNPMIYLWGMWDELVRLYSLRKLTYITDKLPALSGVASRVHQLTQSRYLAGLWEDNPEAALLLASGENSLRRLRLPAFILRGAVVVVGICDHESKGTSRDSHTVLHAWL